MVHRAVVVLAVLGAAGCGHAMSAPMPETKGPIAIRVSDETLSLSQLPIGTYQIPDTAVYVSGHQSEAHSEAAAILGGLVGLAIVHAASQNIAETKTRDARTHLAVDLRAFTKELLADQLARDSHASRIAADGTAAAGTLEVAPFAVMTFISPSRVRFWVGLNASLTGADGKPMWKTRYHSGVGDDRSWTGQDSWTSDDGTLIRDTIRRNLSLALDALVRDVSGTLRQKAGRAYRVTAQWVWAPNLEPENAVVLDESDEIVVVVPNISDDRLIAGVSILDKRSIFMVRSTGR
jgi:hypothetical protein